MLESILLSITINITTKTMNIGRETIPVGVGKTTPTGIFTVERKVIDPIDYSHITKKRTADGTYGDYAILICDKHNTSNCIGIHGTNNQSSIGKSLSAGCIRLLKEDEEYVFNNISFITEVEIIK